ncbi:hypothetical protein [Falsiroseomonas tokyonensis]|uniref:EAL domain-containing protein n=1 Tax=Falsiroseomonas tokyonensis TaxID=430521 RepID=A0ABV7BUG5_9PROT|nr:hypothetical protein [Falsiroseomonas tokyonensis]MBU8538272.1 hypothetical protein [Falsiroseomonas tokyonensis]
MPEGFVAKDVPTPPQQAPLLAVMREALRAAAGRVVLRVPAMAPHRRRVARALLQEGALVAGGVVAEGPNEDLLLIGAEAGRAERLRGLLDRLLGGPVTRIWSLERDAGDLLAYAAEASTPGPAGAGPALAGLDTWLRSLPLTQVVRREIGMRVDPASGACRPAFLRLSIAAVPLAALLGGLGADADLLEHASRGLAARLLLAIGDPAQCRDLMGTSLPGALHLPVPPAPMTGRGEGGQGGPRGGLVATVGLEAVADPLALAARRASLAGQGWALELDGLGASALRILDVAELPVDWLRLAWSPAMAHPAVAEALRKVAPERLILSGIEDQLALDWGRRQGIQRMEGRFLEVASAPVRPQISVAAAGAAMRQGAASPSRPAA